MQNNSYTTKASDKQIAALKRLGYQGDTDAISMAEASALIGQLSNKGQTVGTAYNPNAYEEPQAQVRPNTNTAVAVQTTNVSYVSKSGEAIEFNKNSLNQYLGLSLTTPEFQYFSAVCKNYGLNPFLKDIYAIKYADQPATFIIDYKVLQQAADNDPNFDGLEKGVLFLDKTGQVREREGDYLLPGETILGAWCVVHRKDRAYSPKTYAMFEENCKYGKDGKPMSNWKTRPVFMIVKVAKAQALREAFPNAFSNNTYIPEEFNEEPTNERKHNSIEAVANEQASSGEEQPFEDNKEEENPNDWINDVE
jgi:phage recombination protein Bet